MVDYVPEDIYLKSGSTGDNVKLLQTLLNKLGFYKARIDTYYGSVTYNAVMDFQKQNGLKQDGEAGQETIPVINKKYKELVEKSSEQKKQAAKKKVYVDDFKLDNTHPLIYTFEVHDQMAYPPDGGMTSMDTTEETSTTPKATDHNKNLKLKKYSTNNLVGIPQWNRDGTGLTNEVTVTLVYNTALLDILHESQKASLHIKNGNGNKIYTIDGRISNVKISQEDSLWKIEVNMTGYNDFLNMTVENYNATCKQSEHLKNLIEMCGLKADLQLDGLPDETVTINAQAESNTDNEGDGTTVGEGGTKTIDEIYQMAAQFSYGGARSGGCSASDPDEAWAAYQGGQRKFDCYGCSSFLFYCLKNFAKIPCRIMQGYSPNSDSNTHRVVQIKENGEWHCPKQAWTLTSWLRPFTPEDRFTLHVQGGHQWDG